jgi:hypothetical protein
MIATRQPEPIPDRSVASPESAALQLPEILRVLDVPPRPISEMCIVMRVDQNISFGDFVAFYRALENTGVRKVQLFADLVDDPLRFVRITLPNGQGPAAFFAQMRVYAAANGFQFSQHPWEAESRFQIIADGLAITAEASGGSFRAMLELHPRADGTLPTEPMMDHVLNTFAAAVARAEGSVVVVEPASYLNETARTRR